MYAETLKYYQTINHTYDYAKNYTYDYAKIFCMVFSATLKWKKQQYIFKVHRVALPEGRSKFL